MIGFSMIYGLKSIYAVELYSQILRLSAVTGISKLQKSLVNLDQSSAFSGGVGGYFVLSK